MEDFPFNFNLNYKEEDYITKPPLSLAQLKDIASKQYNITIENMVHINEEEEEMEINNEQNYADLIEYATQHNLKEVKIIINREKEDEEEENEEKEKKGDDIGMNCYDEYHGDIRNKKGGNEEEGYNKHNKGFKEKKRIGYIIEKKQMQRDEDLKNKKEKKKKK